MAEIHFLKDFDHRLDPLHVVAYKAGHQLELEDDLSAVLVARGIAQYVDILEDDLIEGRWSDSDMGDDY